MREIQHKRLKEVDKLIGTIVEVSSVLDKEETAWVPSWIVTETDEEDNERMFIVKSCDKNFNCNGDEAGQNPAVVFSRIRPVPPPPHSDKEYKLLDPVEAFHDLSWRQGVVRGILSDRRYLVSLGASVRESVFNHSDLRPLKDWDGKIWRDRSTKQQTVKATPSSSGRKRLMHACSSGVKPMTPKSDTRFLERTLNSEPVTIAEVSRKRKKMTSDMTDDNTPLSVFPKVKPKAKGPVSSVTPSPVTTSKPVAVITPSSSVRKRSMHASSSSVKPTTPKSDTLSLKRTLNSESVTIVEVSRKKMTNAMTDDDTPLSVFMKKKAKAKDPVSSVTPSPVTTSKPVAGTVTNDDTPSVIIQQVKPIAATPLKPVAETGEKTLEQMKNQRIMESDSTQVKPIAVSTVTPSPVITASLSKQPVAESGEMTSHEKILEQVINQLETAATQKKIKMHEEENSKEESRKRKRDQEQDSNLNETDGTCNGSTTEINDTTGKKICNDGDVNDQPLSSLIERSPDQTPSMVKSSSVAITEDETRGEDRVTSLPFAKKSPYWKTCETTESFKTVPQRPHFSSLYAVQEDFRDLLAVGMTVTFYGLLDEVKGLELDDPPSKLTGLNVALGKLEKHGFDVKEAQKRIGRVMSIQEDRKCLEEKIKEQVNEMRKVDEELERLQAVVKEKKEEGEKKMVEMKSSVETIEGELEEVQIEFQKIVSAPW